MKLNLAENIRKKRREVDLSQEAFAERLGVSFQTISKWERGECYPDIEMLPQIANFFGISVDTLLGADQCREREDVAAIQDELRKFDMLRDEKTLVRLAEDGLKKYPNNHLLMAWIVYGAQNINPKRSIELGEYLLANCRNPHYLNWVRAELCYAYFKVGRQEDGIEAARRLPTYAQTRQAVLEDLLAGEELVTHILEADIIKVCYRFKTAVLKLLNYYKPQEQIELLKKCNAMYEVVFETEDYVYALKAQADTCLRIAEIAMNMGNTEEAQTYINKALTYAQKHDEIPNGTRPQSILCGCEKYGYHVMQYVDYPSGDLREMILSSIKQNPVFEGMSFES